VGSILWRLAARLIGCRPVCISYRSTKSPPYLQSILQDSIPGRAVCSVTRNLICERRTKTATGARAFGAVAPKVWHDLPDSIRCRYNIDIDRQVTDDSHSSASMDVTRFFTFSRSDLSMCGMRESDYK